MIVQMNDKSTTQERLDKVTYKLGLSGYFASLATTGTLVAVNSNEYGPAIALGALSGACLVSVIHNYTKLKSALNDDLVEKMKQAGILQSSPQDSQPTPPSPTVL